MSRDRRREGLLLVGGPPRPRRVCSWGGAGSASARLDRCDRADSGGRRRSGGGVLPVAERASRHARRRARARGRSTLRGRDHGRRRALGERRQVPVQLRNGQVVPNRMVGSGERLSVELTVRRPGWARWLVGHTDHRRFTIETPRAHLLGHWLQVRSGEQVTVAFDRAVSVVSLAGKPRATPSAATERRADRPGRDRLARRRCHRRRRRCAHVGAPGCSRAGELVPLTPVPAAARQAQAGLGRRPEARVHADILEPGRRGAGRPAPAALSRDAGELAVDRCAHAGLPATRARLRARHGGARAAPAGRSPRRRSPERR